MDVLRTGVSFLGNIEPEGDFSNQLDTADRLLACLPSMLLYWHRFHADGGVRIDTETDDDSISGHFLHMLHGEAPKELHRKCLDTTLILYAEHEFNASTFTGRVVAGTGSDMYSCITAAIGALRGPKHGGANEAAFEIQSRSARLMRPSPISASVSPTRKSLLVSDIRYTPSVIRVTKSSSVSPKICPRKITIC